MIVAVGVLSVLCLGQTLVIYFIIKDSRAERKDLHDRILALLSPEAAVVKSSLTRAEAPEPKTDDGDDSDVHFVDEKRELELDGKVTADA